MSIPTILTTVYLAVATLIAALVILYDIQIRGDVDYGMCVATGILWLPAVMFAIYLIQKAD